jgi:hypothetical protein
MHERFRGNERDFAAYYWFVREPMNPRHEASAASICDSSDESPPTRRDAPSAIRAAAERAAESTSTRACLGPATNAVPCAVAPKKRVP